MLLIAGASQAQEKFTLTKEGFTDYVVTETPGLSKDAIYSKTINWIKENYKNPEKAITMTMENEKIRINGFKENSFCSKAMGKTVCANSDYIVEISFRDGKYKLDPIELTNISGANSFKLNFNDTSIYYDSKGDLKKNMAEFVGQLEAMFNDLNQSLKDYITGKNADSDKW